VFGKNKKKENERAVQNNKKKPKPNTIYGFAAEGFAARLRANSGQNQKTNRAGRSGQKGPRHTLTDKKTKTRGFFVCCLFVFIPDTQKKPGIQPRGTLERDSVVVLRPPNGPNLVGAGARRSGPEGRG